MPCKERFPGRVYALAGLLAASSLLAACASGPTSSEALRNDYADVEINRLGGLRLGEKDRQNTAIRNAIEYVEARQVSAESVERITVQNNQRSVPLIGSKGALGKRRSYGYGASSMRLWMTVAECDRDLLFTASSTGRLTSVTDDGRCLSKEPTAEAPGAPPPGWGVIKEVKPAPSEVAP